MYKRQCRDRSIACEKQEYDTLMIWQQAKGQLIMAHEKWITSVINQVGKIKTWLKSWKYLDEALDFVQKQTVRLMKLRLLDAIQQDLQSLILRIVLTIWKA